MYRKIVIPPLHVKLHSLPKPDLFDEVVLKAKHQHAEAVLLGSFTALMISVIFLQKFGVATIPIGLPAAYFILGALLLRRYAGINPFRLVTFSLFFTLGTIGLIVNPNASFSSFALVSVLALPFVIEAPVSRSTFLKCMNIFVVAMLLTGPVIAVEWGLQWLIRPGMWINLDAILPKALLVPGYMYEHPTSFGSLWMQPNAAVFLEVSILSQFLAIAFLIELSYFQRPIQLVALIISMFATMGGSGPFLLTLSVPLVIFYIPRKLLIPAAIFGFCIIFLMFSSDIFSDFSGRIFEYRNPKSSTYGRYVIPLRLLGQQLTQTGGIFYGNGPGSGDAAGAGFSLGKLVFEYGWLAALSYYAMFLHMLIRSGHSALVVWALAIYFSFLGGGLGVPLYPLACMTLGGLIAGRRAFGDADDLTILHSSGARA